MRFWTSSASLIRLCPCFSSFDFSFPLRSLASWRMPSKMASSQRRRSSKDRAGSIIEGWGAGTLEVDRVGDWEGDIIGKTVLIETGDWSGGEDGGVEEASIRNRWLSPRKTLPMAVMVTAEFNSKGNQSLKEFILGSSLEFGHRWELWTIASCN